MCSEYLSCVWTPAIAERIADYLGPNEVSALRWIDNASSQQFEEHSSIRLSQPVATSVFNARWLSPGSVEALNYAQRKKLVCLTAVSGVLENLAGALAATGIVSDDDVLKGAASAGQTRVCHWLADACMSPTLRSWALALTAAAGGGHGELCEWILRRCPSVETIEAIKAAAMAGHVALVEWLPLNQPWYSFWPFGEYPYGRPWLLAIARAAAAATAAAPTPPVGAPASATGAEAVAAAIARSNSRLDGPAGRPLSLVTLAAGGDAAEVARLLSRAPLPSAKECDIAALEAAEAGHVSVLAVLRQAGCDLDPKELAVVATCSGRVSVAAWLEEAFGVRALGLTARLLVDAAAAGSPGMMAWLLERGCGLSSAAWEAAASSGHQAALKLLKEWRCPVPANGAPYEAALRRGDLCILDVLQQYELPCPQLLAEAVVRLRAGHALQEALRRLASEGAAVDWGRLVEDDTLRALAQRASAFVAASAAKRRVRDWLVQAADVGKLPSWAHGVVQGLRQQLEEEARWPLLKCGGGDSGKGMRKGNHWPLGGRMNRQACARVWEAGRRRQ